jgi:hypothetical protein
MRSRSACKGDGPELSRAWVLPGKEKGRESDNRFFMFDSRRGLGRASSGPEAGRPRPTSRSPGRSRFGASFQRARGGAISGCCQKLTGVICCRVFSRSGEGQETRSPCVCFDDQSYRFSRSMVRHRGRDTHFLRDPTHVDSIKAFRGGRFRRGMRMFLSDRTHHIRAYGAFSWAERAHSGLRLPVSPQHASVLSDRRAQIRVDRPTLLSRPAFRRSGRL